jgi:Arc/MetJ-type ribon-helix-helix transcriptional regulator
MAEDLRRTTQVSVRLNQAEVEQIDGLIGYRGFWEVSDLIRAGLQLLLEAEQDDLAARGTTGARKRSGEPKKGKTR